MVLIVGLTEVQAAIFFNGIMTIVQSSLPLALVVVLISLLKTTYPATAWSGISRTIHSSIWPAILRPDWAASVSLGKKVAAIGHIGHFSAFLVIATSVIALLGLDDGPMTEGRNAFKRTFYVPDTSPLGNSTVPRGSFIYGRRCVTPDTIPCPGMGATSTLPQFSPSVFNAFSSSEYSPFRVEYRNYYNDSKDEFSIGRLTHIESQVARNDIFAVEGLVVDMENPGIGFWNHSFPSTKYGGRWSQNILWLEPVSACVDTNIAIDFSLIDDDSLANAWDIVDRGGIVGLTSLPPALGEANQQIVDLLARAEYGSYLAKLTAMQSYNISPNQSAIENVLTHYRNGVKHGYSPSALGKVGALSLTALSNPDQTNTTAIDVLSLYDNEILEHICQNYDLDTVSSISTISIHCSLFFGATKRLDGGDPLSLNAGAIGRQPIYSCATATRASIQTVQFSFSGDPKLENLHISRQPSDISVHWAMEKTGLSLKEGTILWGVVAESFKDDPSLSTVYQPEFYVPAGRSDLWPDAAGNLPLQSPGSIWAEALSVNTWVLNRSLYSGSGSRQLHKKWQSIMNNDPHGSPHKILNSIWTDIAANALLGTSTATSINVVENRPSATYNMLYGIPVVILLVIWIPVISMLLVAALTGFRPSHLHTILDQTSVGRMVVKDSALVSRTYQWGSENWLHSRHDPQSSTAFLTAMKHSGEEDKNVIITFDEKLGWPIGYVKNGARLNGRDDDGHSEEGKKQSSKLLRHCLISFDADGRRKQNTLAVDNSIQLGDTSEASKRMRQRK